MTKFFLLFNTVKYLKPIQLFYRLYRTLFKPKVTDSWRRKELNQTSLWIHHTFYDETLLGFEEANFLNCNRPLSFPESWNDESPGKLWVYNLHYFEDFLCHASSNKEKFHIDFFDKWIDGNPLGKGNGWEPYPISLRISNVLKAWLGGLNLQERHFQSIYMQASFLSNDLEKHLLGNHYFVNLKALLFAGIVFDKQTWSEVAINGLLKEIPEQINTDGGYFELTPMYHSMILVDMLDMYNLLRAFPERSSKEFIDLIELYVPKMIWFMEQMHHLDGEVSFFNDSAIGIAPSKNTIMSYAKKLGFEPSLEQTDSLLLEDFADSGYMVASSEKLKLIFDAARVGPDYIPGHAHADTLSFELSIGKERVIVNSGTSQYGMSEQRLLERKTVSHNTVEIDGKDSSQVWSGFRVAKRAKITERRCRVDSGNILMEAAHDGYKTLFGGVIHKRFLDLSCDTLTIKDSFSGVYNSAVSRFYFHPSLKVFLDDDILHVVGDAFKMKSNLSGLDVSLKSTKWHPEFGVSIPNSCLNIKTSDSNLELTFEWKTK
ncbi:alginate lyase family protein [Psychrosphaera ytuae]|uniref:Alginate lyase family protein n=1 Tax=Psychrosphaera ytuae TaxID=2820710 RepID=A0A975HIU1_9GAMM|nr:heparinase II/III family protein [Psychrosphaera ytuae]QTH64621.1 alginate lyase family protein [Psychrosphaera ytuae]